jgi:hypothetical protein
MFAQGAAMLRNDQMLKLPKRPVVLMPLRASLTIDVPLRTYSEANERGHWAKRHRRTRAAFDAWAVSLMHMFGRSADSVGEIVGYSSLTINLDRHGPSKMDSDNLAGAGKGLRDSLAPWHALHDGDPRLTWTYGQTKSKEYGVSVTLTW